MKPEVVVIGDGGHAKVVADAILAEGRLYLVGFLGAPSLEGRTVLGYPVIGDDDFLTSSHAEGIAYFVLGMGSPELWKRRQDLYEFALGAGFEPAPVRHPSSWLAPSARIGLGTVVLANSNVGVEAEIGENVILNTGSIVEHDARVGMHSHIGPGAVLAGGARVGLRTLIGANAVVLPGVAVGDDVTVGAGSVVTRDVSSGAKVWGAPARSRP